MCPFSGFADGEPERRYLVRSHGATNPAGSGAILAALRDALASDFSWTPAGEIQLKFPTYHPQGMVKIGGLIYLSSVKEPSELQATDPLARARSERARDCAGYLFKADLDGNLIAQVELGDGTRYHPGGLDFDGRWIWVPVAEYLPDSSSIIFRVDPETLAAKPAFRVPDHIGDLSYNRSDDTLHGFSWGARRHHTWKIVDGAIASPLVAPAELDRPDFMMEAEYQDCHYVGSSYALCSSSTHFDTSYLGSLDLVDLDNDAVVQQLIVHLRPDGSDRPMTHNPMFFERLNGVVRFYFAPEDDRTTIYMFDAA
jgi:hypothetical protein